MTSTIRPVPSVFADLAGRTISEGDGRVALPLAGLTMSEGACCADCPLALDAAWVA